MSRNYFSRLHFSIRSNVKVGMLTDQAFRMYIYLLTLNGDGSVDKNPPDEWIARQCGVALSDAVRIKGELAKADLLVGSSWKVKNYDDRQYKNPAQARYDNKKSDKKSYGVSCDNLSDVEEDVDVDVSYPTKKKNQDTSGKPSGEGPLKLKQEAQEVLDYLNQVTGKKFTRVANILACLKREKCSVKDCRRVIDFKWSEWKGKDLEKNVNPTTLWRPSHFADYLDQAGAGAKSVHVDLRPKDEWGKVIPQWKIDMRKQMEEDNAK